MTNLDVIGCVAQSVFEVGSAGACFINVYET